MPDYVELTENKIDIKSLTLEELTEEFGNLNEKAFRAKQAYAWMHEKLVRSFDEMSNLSKDFREKLKARYQYTALEIKKHWISFRPRSKNRVPQTLCSILSQP